MTGSTLKSGERRLVYNVYQYFMREKEAGSPLHRIDAVLGKTVAATGRSRAVIHKIASNPNEFEHLGKSAHDRKSMERWITSIVEHFEESSIDFSRLSAYPLCR